MKKFKVKVVCTTWKSTEVEIEADSKAEAEKAGIKKAFEDVGKNEWMVLAVDKYTAEAERINPPVDVVDFPAYALTALINGDFSGMSSTDSAYLRGWQRGVETRLKAQHPGCEVLYSPGENTYFSTAQVFGLPADCVELEIHVIGGK